MRIGIDARSVYPGHGGIGTYARELARALARVDGHNEYLLFCTERKGTEPIVVAPNVRELICPAAMLDWRWEQLELPTLAQTVGLDVLHLTCFTAPIAKTCAVVSTVHDVVFHVRPDLVEPKLAAYLSRWAEFAARQADRLIAVSQHARQAIADAYGTPLARIAVVYEAPGREFCPRDRAEAAERVRSRFGIDGSYCLYVGALEPKKNIDGLLDAFAELVSDGFSEGSLVLVGGRGGMPYDIEQAVLLRRLQDSVRLLGYVPEAELPFLYRAAAVFIYPSLYEGFGLPPLEAMACGTPTIVSNSTSLPEVVGDAALLADPEDPGQLADAMARVLQDSALSAELSRKGVERSGNFTWEEAARGTLRVYESAATEGGRSNRCEC